MATFFRICYGCSPFSSSPFLSASLSHTHTHRRIKLGIPHGAVHSCVRQAKHPLCMPHTHSLFTWVSATRKHAHTQTTANRDTHMHAYTKWPTDTQALSQMPGNLPQGLNLCLTHTQRHLALRHCVSFRRVGSSGYANTLLPLLFISDSEI